MTTKDFAQMTTKKLNALLATASDEDKKAIEAVLEAREQAQASVNDDEDAQLTPEEEAAVEAAEENDGLNPLYNGSKATQEKKNRLTDEERHSLAVELKKNVYHRCQVVPFNSVDWVDGYIAGVIEEKRTNKVLYAIKTDDGRRVVKVSDSNLIRILDETIERPAKRVHVPKSQKVKLEKRILTPEEIREEINKVIGNVGKLVKYEKYTTVNKETGEERTEYAEGRIIAITPDYRSQSIFYRISIPAPVEGNPLAVKITHKNTAKKDLIIAEDFDEQGKELNTKYLGRYTTAAARSAITPQARYTKCEEAVKKVEAKLQKVTAELEAKKKQLENAKAELDAFFTAQTQSAQQDAEKTEEEEPLA